MTHAVHARINWRRCLLLCAVALAGSALIQGCSVTIANPTQTDLKQQVLAAERAFAKTMVDRDLTAFGNFVSEEAVFFSGAVPLRGKEAVVNGWRGLYATPQAPFSWEPKDVEVLPSGTLAMSSGPVYNPSGKLIATFTSIWRLEAPGTWRVVFDKGNDACDCPKP